MNGKSKLGPLDVGTIVAAGVFIVGAFLPLWIADYPTMTITADLLDFNGGIIAVLAALTAIVLTVRNIRVGALIALTGAGSIVVWRVIDIVSLENFTLSYGAYVMFAGLLGGIASLTLGLVRFGLGARTPEESAPPETPVDFEMSTSSHAVDVKDLFPVVE